MKNFFGSLGKQLAYYEAHPDLQLNTGGCAVLRAYANSVRYNCRFLVINDIPYGSVDLSVVLSQMVSYLREWGISEFVFAESSTASLRYLCCLLRFGCKVDSPVSVETLSPYKEVGRIEGLLIKLPSKVRR